MTLDTPAIVAGPNRLEGTRFLLHFRRDPIKALQGLAQTYGDIAHVRFGKQQVYLLSHPDMIRDVLVVHQQQMRKPNVQRVPPLGGKGLLRSEGEYHKRQRRLIQSAFHRQRIATYAQAMIEYTQRTCARWHDGQAIDVAQEMMGLTLSIIGKTMFGSEVESDTQSVYDGFTTWMRLTPTNRVGPLDNLLDALPSTRHKQRTEARAQLDAVVYRIINERRASDQEQGDLLSMLLEAHDVEGDGSGMTDEQLRDEVMTLFLAGHETTANALAWTWYLLAQHPEVEEKLHQELASVLAGRQPTPEDLPRLPYVEMVLTESMRLYPPAWMIARRAIEEYRVGDYQIPAGAIMIMSQYVVHHDPRWYPDPQHFDPERWTPEARAGRPKYAYFPFGGGPRLCIGEPFAWMEGELVLASLAQEWRLRLTSEQPVELEPLITLRPKGGIPMIVERR